jgi:enterochelin esterase-like enzyme
MPTREFLIESRSLGKRRAATVFLPFNYTSARMYPIVFCTDGQVLNSFTQRIERDIRNLELGELVLVGVHSSRERSEEYCLTQNEGLFHRHEQFFTDEVPDWLRKEFGLVVERDRTGVFGYSYGAAFALTMASRRRDLFGLIIAFSVAGKFEEFEIKEQDVDALPRFYLSAGTREKALLKTTRRFAKHLKQQKIEHVITERYSGHDFGYWESELPLAVRWGFPMDSLQKD